MTIKEFMSICRNEWGYICIDGKAMFIGDWRKKPIYEDKEISSIIFNSGIDIITKQ